MDPEAAAAGPEGRVPEAPLSPRQLMRERVQENRRLAELAALAALVFGADQADEPGRDVPEVEAAEPVMPPGGPAHRAQARAEEEEVRPEVNPGVNRVLLARALGAIEDAELFIEMYVNVRVTQQVVDAMNMECDQVTEELRWCRGSLLSSPRFCSCCSGLGTRL